MNHTTVFNYVGDVIGNVSQKAIQGLSSVGLQTTPTTSKWIVLAIILGLIWLISSTVRRPSKWAFIIVLGVIGVSILTSI